MSAPRTSSGLVLSLLPWSNAVLANWQYGAREQRVSGGRGILKTTAGFQLLTVWTLAAKRQGTGYYLGPYHNQVKKSVWHEANLWLESQPERIKLKDNATDLTVDLVDGKRLAFIGMDKYQGNRGIHPLAVVADEVSRIKRAAFDEVVIPAQRNHRGPCLDITTPTGSNWWKARWEEGEDPKETEIASWKIKAADVGMVSAADLAKERARMSPELYAQEWEGEFTTASGPVFQQFINKRWSLGHFLTPAQARQVQREGGYQTGAMDWAYTGTAVLLWLWVTKRGGVIVLDELTCSKKTPAQMMTLARARRALPPAIWLDTACWSTTSDGISVGSIARGMQTAAGPRVAIRQADKRFPESLNKINELMTITGDEAWPQFGIVEGAAPNLVTQLQEIQEEDVKPRGGGFRESVPCDSVDALRYGVMAARAGVTGGIVVDDRPEGPLARRLGRRGEEGDDIVGWDPVTGTPEWARG